MTTAVTKALKKAGVETPTNTRRIWQWLKDQGAHDYKQVARALNIPESNASSVLSALEKRDIVKRIQEYDSKGKKIAARYEAKGLYFELKPLPSKKPAANGSAVPVPTPVTVNAPMRLVFNAKTFVQDLTLRELEQVYQYTKRFFD